MKKLLLILLCLPIIGFGQEQINIIDVKGYHYNDILNNMIECNLSIKYDETNQVTYFYISETISTVAYSLSKEDVFRLNEIFEKYFEWEKKAIEMKVKLDKSIDDRLFIGWFKYGNGDWANSKNKNCSFNALFFLIICFLNINVIKQIILFN